MAQGATHEPPYRQTIQSAKRSGPKCEKVFIHKKEFLTESKSEEEAFSENSTDRSYVKENIKTEAKEPGWNSMNRIGKTCDQINSPENFLYYSYLPESNELKENKLSQKNNTGSLSSFVRSPDNHDFRESKKPKLIVGKSYGKGEENYRNLNIFPGNFPSNFQVLEKNDFTCFHHRQKNYPAVKLCEKHKVQADSKLGPSKFVQPALSCLNENESSQNLIKESQTTLSGGVSSKNSTDITTITTTLTNFSEKPKSFEEESRINISKCPVCLKFPFHNSDENKLRDAIKSCGSRKELGMHKKLPSQLIPEEENLHKLNKTNSRIREKLVYVIEEDGKDSTKMETDLFSFNEILAIKKDLLELSNFAKKLKQLKEIKKESDSEKDCNNQCRCNIAAELLKNVNKRIEALETRQEELEKGSSSKEKNLISDQQSEKDWKINEEFKKQPKFSQVSPSLNTPAMAKQSGILSVPSFSKTEMIVSRAEGFSNNLEIVSELMDIKNKLQKLEKKRMSKEPSAEALHANSPKLPKKKRHAIAVFSSKTYILAPDNRDKKKNELMDIKGRESFINDDSHFTKNESPNQKIAKKSEKMKEAVANWLKSVTGLSESSSRHDSKLVVAEISGKKKPKNEEPVAKFEKTDEILENGDFENQEMQTIREMEKEKAKQKTSWLDEENKKFLKTSCGDFRWPLKSKTCYLTSSGRLFTLKQKPETVETMNLMLDNENAFQALDKAPPKVFSNIIRQSISSSSVPSVIVAKERIKRINKSEGKENRSKNFGESRSKSMEILSLNSNVSGHKKNVSRLTGKKFIVKDKKSKESKNEMVKKEEEESMNNLKKRAEKKNLHTTLSSNSELLGSVNLEANKSSVNKGIALQDSLSNKIQLYSVTTLSGNDFRYCSPADKFVWMIQHAEQKDRKKEKIKRNEPGTESKSQCAVQKSSKLTKKEKSIESKKEKKLNLLNKNSKKSKNLTKNEQTLLKNLMNCQHLCSPLHSECSSTENFEDVNCTSKNFSTIKKSKRNNKTHSEEIITNKIESESEESTDSFRKNKNEKKNQKYKTKVFVEKTEEDSCIMGNFFKNLRGLYPKIGRFKDVPWLGYCDKECKKKKHLEKVQKEKELRDKDFDEDDQFLKNQAGQKQSVFYHNFYPRKENSEEIRFEHLKKCKCVQEYMQSQNDRDWPGSRPFQPLLEKVSSQNINENECKPKPLEYYIGYSTEGEKRHRKKSSHKHRDSDKSGRQNKHTEKRHHNPKKKEEKHHRKEKHVKTKKHPENQVDNTNDKKKEKHKKKEKKNKCVCDKCGNVHRKKKPKKPKKTKKMKEECENTLNERDLPAKNEELKEEPHSEEEHHEDEKSEKPYLSFFKGFCSKPSKQSKSFLSNKFNELRYLKACSMIKKGKCVEKKTSTSSVSKSQSFSNKEKQVDFEDTRSTDTTPKTDNTTDSERIKESDANASKKCYCKMKLDDIEDRLKSLESHSKKKRKKSPSNENYGKKEKKHKKKHSSSSGSAKEKNKPKKSVKGCRKKNETPKETTAAYFCTCLSVDDPFAKSTVPKTNSVNNNLSYSSMRTEENKTNKGTRLKRRLSSFQYIWKSFRKHVRKRGEGDFNEILGDQSNDAILDDCSKSSPVPKTRAIFSLKNEPSNIFSKQKKKKSKKKDRERKEKSKSKSKRHK